MAHVSIAINTDDGTFTEHWTTSYIQARGIVACYVTDNGLYRNAYGDTEYLFRDGAVVGHYCITMLP